LIKSHALIADMLFMMDLRLPLGSRIMVIS